MKTIFKQTGALILTTILTVTTFAAAGKNSATFVLKKAATFNVNTVQNGVIPSAVLDGQFRWWQPTQPAPMYASYARNDIAWTNGYAIYYNPRIFSQAPPKIQAFFLAHEYGHIYGRTANEFQADQFAARVYAQTDVRVVKAAIWHFANIQGSMCDVSHGCGWQRALNIGQTAGFSREQIEIIVRGNF